MGGRPGRGSMMDLLVLRFDAPLISFGAPIIDRHGVIQPYPALSMITGLLGNALGYDHADWSQLERLQERIRYASRQDRSGRQLRDYQTVDLSKPYMSDENAWTTRHMLEKREGGSAKTGTHVRLRDYWADAIHTVVLTLNPPDERPNLDDLEQALRNPERPLFLGRKACLPATPIYRGHIQAASLKKALSKHVELDSRADNRPKYRSWWPSNPQNEEQGMKRPVTDQRDWANQIHVGERWITEGEIEVTAKEEQHGD